jgi:hypothetical protein
MSVLFLTVFIAMLSTDASFVNSELMYIWALFSIADALWARIIFGRK